MTSFFIRWLVLCVLCTSAWATAPRTVLVFGDSLSAGYGIALADSWPSLLGKRLDQSGSPYQVVNASISGETSAGGRARLQAALADFRPKVLVLALGANDGLRGLPPQQLRDNLRSMVKLARQQGVRTLLVGMKLPPNYGPAYNEAFNAAFVTVAKEEKVPLLPFLLEPIATDASAFQSDRLHPVAAAQPKLLDHVWSALKPLLK
jgi:acyl-CoA thioesterase-1